MRVTTNALAFILLLVGVVLPSSQGYADQGVGVNLGSINVDDRLRPGGDYGLPTLGVLNSGDEPGEYILSIGHDEKQTELEPPVGWFEFQPPRFHLDAGETRNVDIRLKLPSGADPGDYFAYIEARPVAKSADANVGIAAATRLSFTVEPSSWLDAQRRIFERWYNDNLPWTFVLPVLGLLSMALFYASKRLRFRLPFEPR